MERITNRLVELKPKLNAIRDARDKAISDGEEALRQADGEHKAQLDSLKADSDGRISARTAERNALLAQKDKRRKAQTARAEKAWLRIKKECDSATADAVMAIEGEQKEKHARGAKAFDGTAAAVKADGDRLIARIEGLQAQAKEALGKLVKLDDARGLGLDPKKARETALLSARNANLTVDDCEQQLAQTTETLNTSAYGPTRGRSVWPISLFVTILFVGAGFAVYQQMPDKPWHFAVGGGWILVMGLIFTVYQSVREKLGTAANGLLHETSRIQALLEMFLSSTQESLANELKELENQEVHRICGIDETVKERIAVVRKKCNQDLATLRTRLDGAKLKVTKRAKAEQAKVGEMADADFVKMRDDHAQKVKKQEAAHAARRKQLQQKTAAEIAAKAADWKATIDGFVKFGDEEKKHAAADSPLAIGLSSPDYLLPIDFPSEVYLSAGTLRLRDHFQGDDEGPFSVPDLACSVPFGLNYPNLGSMFVRSGATRRDAAMNMLLNAAMRMLCAFPAAKCKLTIMDPIGVGQNFGAFMHLTDYDDSLVNGKIWSDGAHIERKLVELTEHIEKVTQKYLRNRYETVNEFNKEAGQMSVPYQFLIVSDFPTALSELALERLSTIINSGPRCGVYTFIYHNSAMKMPAVISETQLKKNGLFLVENGDDLTVNGLWTLNGAWNDIKLPSNEDVNVLMSLIGKQCISAGRVQVPFSVVSPKAPEFWKSESDSGIRLPLGMAGADRLQYLQLGGGTSQHALIAGKTGSGKSNLFHVIISNAASWYSPYELEFYLIDFKKGVEFKTYGDHLLPHARVVAIESDREFGLSVLRRIDKELSVRGELFRQARVQDFPSFRKSPNAQKIPRTLLMIDEFQEYFTDDDAVAQEAALYLDRIVRQGRAFGIHVILGTQTLGGTYSLSKSTLGQIAVRIALQCNEADSYLVLSDDNAAASLLTRPGEAIYNDMAGFVEGNSPFQAVYFARKEQDVCLDMLRQRADEANYKPAEPPAIFEGNALADMRNNSELARRVDAAPVLASAPRVWMGEANAIKGPTQAEFVRQAGSNLLIVGQRGETPVAAAALSLVASSEPGQARVIILDGNSTETGGGERLKLLMQAFPGQIEIAHVRRLPEIMAELAAIVEQRQGAPEAAAQSVFLLVVGLERFRALREEEEFAFGSSSEEGAAVPPAKNFGKILSDGPNEGIHSILWCDTLGNLNRTFSRKTLREFESRVLYQMSANDSSELVDSPVANNLGMYSAILFTAQNGGVEKFRPYAEPTMPFLQEYSEQMRRKRAEKKMGSGTGPALVVDKRKLE